MRVIEADQYPIRFTITDGVNELVTPQTVSEVRIKVNDQYFKYPDGGLFYDNFLNRWYFHLEQVKTIRGNFLAMEVQTKINGNPPIIKGTRTKQIPINKGIIKETWNE